MSLFVTWNFTESEFPNDIDARLQNRLQSRILHQILIYFEKKVPKSDYFWRFCRTFLELPSSRYSSRGSLIMFYAPPYINGGSRPLGVRPESRTEERNSDFFGIFGSALVSKLWEKSPCKIIDARFSRVKRISQKSQFYPSWENRASKTFIKSSCSGVLFSQSRLKSTPKKTIESFLGMWDWLCWYRLDGCLDQFTRIQPSLNTDRMASI